MVNERHCNATATPRVCSLHSLSPGQDMPVRKRLMREKYDGLINSSNPIRPQNRSCSMKRSTSKMCACRRKEDIWRNSL